MELYLHRALRFHVALLDSAQKQPHPCSVAVPARRNAAHVDHRRAVPAGRRPDAALPAYGGGGGQFGAGVCG